MKALVLVTCLVAVALSGCRRQEAYPDYEQMKLNGAVHSHE